MTHEVVIVPRARIQLHNAAIWWAEHRSLDQAARWLSGFEEALAALAENPDRHATAPENDAFAFTLRQLNYGLGNKPTHRALFEVRQQRVIVHSIRHLAQQPVTPDDLAGT